MMRKLRVTVTALMASLMIGLSVVPAAGAVNVLDTSCGSAQGKNAVCQAKGDDLNTTMKKVINMLLYIVGLVSVISIIIGGILYTTSVGDQSKIQTAKNTIMYAVIGLVVAILAFAIVNFVISNIG